MGLSPAQAKQLLEANSVLLVKKVVEERKPLSQQEIALLEQVAGIAAPDAGKWAKDQVQLADILGVDRKTIQRWLKITGNPGKKSDGRYAVEDWKSWRASRGGDGDDSPDQTRARAEQILLQNERLRHKIGEEKKKLIPKAVAQKIFGKLLLDAKNRCFSSTARFVTLARMAKDADEANDELRKEMIEIWKALEDSKWAKS